jgi:hypothetical protein
MLPQLGLSLVLSEQVQLEEVLISFLLPTLFSLFLIQQLSNIFCNKGAGWYIIKTSHAPTSTVGAPEHLELQAWATTDNSVGAVVDMTTALGMALVNKWCLAH